MSHGLSGALRMFGFFLANGTVGLPLLEGVDYWTEMAESPSLLEQTIAIYANVLRLDDDGVPLNQGAAQTRAAEYIYQYMTGEAPEREWEDWEVALH